MKKTRNLLGRSTCPFKSVIGTHWPLVLDSDLGSASLTELQFALVALRDVPMRPAVAHVAVPENERGVGLDRLERMIALARLCHVVCVGFAWEDGCLGVVSKFLRRSGAELASTSRVSEEGGGESCLAAARKRIPRVE